MRRIFCLSENSPWIYCLCVSFIINGLLFGVFFGWMNPQFGTNDDVGMMLTASGLRTGEPSEYLIYSNVIIGKILKIMYLRLPDINWYSIYLFSAHFFAMLILLYSVLRLKPKWSSVFQYLFLFIFCEYPLLMKLHFTSTACVVGLSGICLLMASLGINKKKSFSSIFLAAILLGIASLIRFQVFYLLILLSGPILLYKFWDSKTFKIPVFWGVSLLFFAVFAQYNSYYFAQDPQWKEYYEYNYQRSQLNGYPKLAFNEQNKPVFAKIGWNKNDFLMFRYRFNFDQEVYSKEKLTFLNQNLKSQRNIKEAVDIFLGMCFSNKIPVLFSIIYLLFSLVFLGKNHRIKILILFLTAIGICGFLSYFSRLPDHVFISIVIFVSTMTLLLINSSPVSSFSEMSLKKKAFILVIASSVILLLLPQQLAMIQRRSRDNKSNNLSYKKTLRFLPPGRDKLYVVMAGSPLNLQCTSPYSNLMEYRDLNFFNTGYLINSGHNQQIMAKFGIHNIYQSLITNDHVFILMNTDLLFRNMLRKFMMEHYRQKIDFEDIAERNNLGVYKVFQVESTGDQVESSL